REVDEIGLPLERHVEERVRSPLERTGRVEEHVIRMDERPERGPVLNIGVGVSDRDGRDAVRPQERDRMPTEEPARAEDQDASQASLRPKTTSQGTNRTNRAAVRIRLASSLETAA